MSPHRLLQVIGSEVRLRHTSGFYKNVDPNLRYVCLSHCWGSSHVLRTTTSNLEMHCNGIPWESLPKSFQDAITFCRFLGVEYLWIDSLCIIQDSTDDWHAQAKEMESIYRGAYFTIAATGARDSTFGLFVDTEDCGIQGAWGTIFSRKLIEQHLDGINATLFPLLTRGWVYQERLLSRRILHFGPHELFWECYRSINCECGGCTSSIMKPPKISHRSVFGIGTLSQEITVRWREIVSEFTGMQLTYPTDRLAALHGVAKQIGSA